MLPSSSIPVTTPLAQSLAQLQVLTDQQSIRERLENGSGQLCCQRVIEHCVRQMLKAFAEARQSSKAVHVSVARESCKVIGLVMDSIANKSRYAESIAVRSGVQFLATEVERIENEVQNSGELVSMIPLAALLVNEFDIKSVTIRKEWMREAAARHEGEEGGLGNFLAIAS